MLEFNLEISRDGATYYAVDLFTDQQLDYDVDFYDSLSLDKIKMPFQTDMKLPLTPGNMSANLINYNPSSSASSDFPRDDFFYKLTVFGTAVSNMAGIMNVTDIEYNSSEPYISVKLRDQLSYYLSKVKEVNMAELYDQAKYTDTNLTLSRFTFYSETNNSTMGQKGTIGVNPDTDSAIVFPYVDMNNDTQKYGYPARQFLEYGTGNGRSGLIPAFSVQKFLEYVGDYLSTTNFPVRVDSHLFAVGSYTTPYTAAMQPEKLRFTNSSHMLAKQAVNTRTFTLRQSSAWAGTNASMAYMKGTEATFRFNSSIGAVNNDEKWFRTSYWGSMENHGNAIRAAVPTGLPAFSQQEFGCKKLTTSYPEDENESIRGWFCPKVSYQANARLNGNPTLPVSVSGLQLEIPVVKEDGMVIDVQFDNALTTMEFALNVGIYEDGMMIKRVPMEDSNGDPLRLQPNGRSSTRYSNKEVPWDGSGVQSPTDYIDEDENYTYAFVNGTSARDVLTFPDVDIYFPTDIDVFVNGGSKYSTNYSLEPVSGVLQARVFEEFALSFITPPATGNLTPILLGLGTPVWLDFDFFDLKKLITRIPTLTEAEKLDITLLASEDFLPHQLDDKIVIKDSIAQTTEDSIYDVLLKISKRFNCGFFYNYDSVSNENVFRIDPLHVMRSGTQDISSMIEDAKSFKTTIGGSKIKNLVLSNEDYGRYFDRQLKDKVLGSTTQEINPEGIKDLEIKLDSSIFYKSLAFDETVERPQNLLSGAFSEEQLGVANNIFSINEDAGFRFAYIKQPEYNTWILHPYMVYNEDATLSGQMKTEVERLYGKGSFGFDELTGSRAHTVMNGELTHISPLGFDLRAEDEDGNTTGYYDLYSAAESLKTANLPTVEFDMVVPTSYLSNLDFFMQTLTAPQVTNNNIYVKSAKGDVYGDFAYLTIEGLID